MQTKTNLLKHLGDSRAAVTSDTLYALGIKRRHSLLWRFVHQSHIPLLGLKNAWVIDLPRVQGWDRMGWDKYVSLENCTSELRIGK